MILPFLLNRKTDYTGVSGSGIVAEGVRFSDGTCVVRWRGPTSTTAVHADIASVRTVHGHAGSTEVQWLDTDREQSPFMRGQHDCIQDRFENAPFGSVGGVESRRNMCVPSWIGVVDAEEYLSGYRDAAWALYGPDWQTCAFAWTKALEIP